MHALRELLQDLFGFSERETRGFFLLLALLFGLVALSLAWASLRRPTPTTARDAAQLDSLFALLQDMPTTAAAVPSYFAFDPNTATLQDWQTLGVPEPLAQRILNYRQKGGQFRKAEDVQKIYGFPEETFQKLKPYMRIPSADKLTTDPPETPIRYFAFDPNTATLQDWQTLGVPEPLAQRILNYRQKGGQFRKAEDVQKIYGFPEETFQKLEPYIQISAVSALDNAPKNAPLTRFDLNEADTTTLKKIRGIGSGYAKRIVEWRQKLGGFYRVEQVAELYRFPPETFQELAKYAYLESPALRQIPINTADVATLQAHPYLSYKQAQALVRYRTEHGLFNSPDDLVKVRVLDAQAIERLKPYLKF